MPSSQEGSGLDERDTRRREGRRFLDLIKDPEPDTRVGGFA
jgi:hypothetical protein